MQPVRRSLRLLQKTNVSLQSIPQSIQPSSSSPLQQSGRRVAHLSSSVSSSKRRRIERPKRETKSQVETSVGGSGTIVATQLPASCSRDLEDSLIAKGREVVVGVDEAGRGPLAGPVCAAAVWIPPKKYIPGLCDSKQLSEEERELVFSLLTDPSSGVAWSVATVSNEMIDEHNILQATLHAMTCAVENLDRVLAEPETPREAKLSPYSRHNTENLPLKKIHWVLLDGNRLPPRLISTSTAVVKGDSKSMSIAAASIIAKVTRDRIMIELDREYPCYELAQHKGYPTPAHMAAVRKHGPSRVHRVTFAPIKHMSLPDWAEKRLLRAEEVREEVKKERKQAKKK